MFNSDQINQKVSEWKRTSGCLKEYTDKCSDSQSLMKIAQRIVECGQILDTYADLIQFASEKYEENEKSLIKSLEK